LLNLSDYETQARKILDNPVLDYFDGGANDEITLRENPSAFGRIDPSRQVRRVPLEGKMYPMADGSKRYSAELKKDAVAMVGTLVADGGSEWAAMRKTADLLGISTPETVRRWVRGVPVEGVDRAAAAKEDSEVIRKLRRENLELKRANGILKAASVFFAAELDRPHH